MALPLTTLAGPSDPCPVPQPRPDAIVFDDVREGKERRRLGVVGFYYPGHEEVWDTICGAGFLGNFYELGRSQLELSVPGFPDRPKRFGNAEAAFQALKFWEQADEFAGLSGKQACRLKRRLAGGEDRTYGGFGSNWRGMWAVLQAKFKPGTSMAEALLRTGDAFLLEHNPVTGRDRVWSDNCDGKGTNWLGLQLMLVRDQLSGAWDWTKYIRQLVDQDTGLPHNEGARRAWQAAVRSAQRAVVEAARRLERSGMGDKRPP